MLLQTLALPALLAQPCTNDGSILISENGKYRSRENEELPRPKLSIAREIPYFPSSLNFSRRTVTLLRTCVSVTSKRMPGDGCFVSGRCFMISSETGSFRIDSTLRL